MVAGPTAPHEVSSPASRIATFLARAVADPHGLAPLSRATADAALAHLYAALAAGAPLPDGVQVRRDTSIWDWPKPLWGGRGGSRNGPARGDAVVTFHWRASATHLIFDASLDVRRGGANWVLTDWADTVNGLPMSTLVPWADGPAGCVLPEGFWRAVPAGASPAGAVRADLAAQAAH